MIRLENILKISLQDVLKTSWQDVLKMSWRCLENVLKTSWRRLKDIWPRQIYWSWPRRLEDVLKTSSEDVWLRRIYSTWSRRLEDVLKTSSSRRMFGGKLANTLNLLWQITQDFTLNSSGKIFSEQYSG